MQQGVAKKPKNLSDQIYAAVFKKNHEELGMLLSDENLNLINCNSSLDFAAVEGDILSLELLLAHGAIPDYQRRPNILYRSIKKNNHNVIELLVQNGCDPDDTDDNIFRLATGRLNLIDSWFIIIHQNDLPIFQWLLEKKGRKIGDDKWSQKMLIYACCFGSEDIFEYLLNQGVPVESIDEDGWTFLFYTVAYRQISLVQKLIARSANLEHKDFQGRSLLHIAALHSKEPKSTSLASADEIVKLIIDKGAEINATDNKNLTPINTAFTALTLNSDFIMWFLQHYYVDLAKPDIEGVTVLHRLVPKGESDLLQEILSKHNVNVNARDKESTTPLQLIKKNCLKSLSLLLEFGANTKDLHRLKEDVIKDENFLKILGDYKLKRTAANLSNDLNVNSFLDLCTVFSPVERAKLMKVYSNEIELMKVTNLCDKITFYDFLHGKVDICVSVAKKLGMRELLECKSVFKHYVNMLSKKYPCRLRRLTPVEFEALNLAEKNLNLIFRNKLSNSIVLNIEKYIDVKDMVTLKNMKLCGFNDNEFEKN